MQFAVVAFVREYVIARSIVREFAVASSNQKMRLYKISYWPVTNKPCNLPRERNRVVDNLPLLRFGLVDVAENRNDIAGKKREQNGSDRHQEDGKQNLSVSDGRHVAVTDAVMTHSTAVEVESFVCVKAKQRH
jgi:hypothetical protein